ncbi:helicase with zinc finger domain 2-like [Saccostrea echinata]|uniref:helicase with zinc finger domain 2-like n=1 Tax=Saccostrea echinata TaxID=191078 RepID=UPI002A7EE7F5|nr:helicase with zinc finger domain 2-like [Saccostrea echinata]
MSSESEEDNDRSNYFQLRTCFDDDCTHFLRKLLESYFPTCADLLKELPREMFQSENPNGIISRKQHLLIKNETVISKKFKFELLCNILRTGVCDKFFSSLSLDTLSDDASSLEHQSIGDNIEKMWQIWVQNLSNNEEEEISDSDKESIWNTLIKVADCMAKVFPNFGKKFFKNIEKKKEAEEGKYGNSNQIGEKNKIEHTNLENSAETIVCNQYGTKNKISSENVAQHAVKTFICKQQGGNNKIAITLDNQTKTEFDIEGKGMRLTLHSTDRSVFPEIASRIGRLSIRELNEDQCLKENAVEITAIQNACLIVDLKITGSDIEGSMGILLECLMQKSNAYQILIDNDVSELSVFGYYYLPQNYIDTTDLKMNFILFNHVTLTLKRTIGDIDVFVSDSLHLLIHNSFKADVDENLRVQIKGDIVDPQNLRFKDIQGAFTNYTEKQLATINYWLESECHLKIIKILRQNSVTHVILKTESCITYGSLTEKKGPIVTLLHKIFEAEGVEEKLAEVSIMRIGLLVNTSMDEEFHEEPGKGIVFYLSPESKISEVIEKNKFPEVLQAMLGGKNEQIMKGAKQMKIRAVLNYERNGDDSDQAIEISETYEEETTEEKMKRFVEQAKNKLQSDHMLEAKEIARTVFERLSDEMDINIFKDLTKIFEKCADNFYALKCFCKDRDGDEMDANNLFMWAKALNDLRKFDVALKKTEEAIEVHCAQTEITLLDLRKFRDSLILEWNRVPKDQGHVDAEWLFATNISMPQQMKEKALQAKEKHVKRPGAHRRPKRPEKEKPKLSPTEEFEKSTMSFEDTSKYRTWKDVPHYVPEPIVKKKRRKLKKTVKEEEDYDVEIVERKNSDSDSGQASISENEYSIKKPFSYEAPEYQISETDTFSDSGFDTFDDEAQLRYSIIASSDKTPTNSDLVVFGLTLTDDCKASFQIKRKSKPFQYQNEMDVQNLLRLLQWDKNKYKRCSIEIESAHRAVCKNLDLADDVKEIVISGRSKCGKAFSDDEVVVEVLGESKAQSSNIPRLKKDVTKEIKDNDIFGKVLGRLKRNRYGDLEHPVLICSKDEFADHKMIPLCKTVPKINVSHKKCKHKYQVDLFSYDTERSVVEYRTTLDINPTRKQSCCFLVAILNWNDMYPFGITLSVINTKGDIKSGLGILQLQYRVPCTYSKETREATESILEKRVKAHVEEKKVIKVFTIDDGKEGATETSYSVNLVESGLYRIGVHVIDPTSVIKKGDALDLEARRHGSDFYVNKDIHPVFMIPERLSNELFNMETGKEREALSVFFDFSIDEEEIDSLKYSDIKGQVKRSVVKSEKQYNISDVQNLLSSKHMKSDIHVLYMTSRKLRKKRIGNASYYTEVNEMFPYEKNNFIECIDAHLLVQELDIFTNQSIAKFLFAKYPRCVPCKCHVRPSEKLLLRWKNAHNEHMDNILFHLQDCEIGTGAVCSIFNCKPSLIRYRHHVPVQNNVWDALKEYARLKQYDKLQVVLGADEIHPLQNLALEEWIEIQEAAEYKCLISKQLEALHFDLRVPIFTTFTAPLRRFIDLVVHRMVHAALDNLKEPPYSENEIQKICVEMNQTNRIRKQFRKSCLKLLFAHSLSNDPRVFNGFIRNVTNNDVELTFPTLRKLSRASKLLPINLLHSKQKPKFEKEIGFDRYFMTIKWQNRIYSLNRRTKNPPKENTYLRINPHQNVQFHQLRQWVNIIQALLNGKTKNIHSLMSAVDQPTSNEQISASWNTVNDVSSEIRGGYFAQQICNYSLSFSYGQLVVIQMCSEPERGIMTPMPQLFDITPNIKICLQHARDPLGTLSSIATKSTNEKYSSCSEYINIWMPIFSMEVAIQTADDDSITISDLPITFRLGGGGFSLKQSFLEKRDIHFTAHSTDLLNTEEDVKKDNEEDKERFYMPGSDFLCIRCPLEPLSDVVSNFGRGAISPRQRYWIGHAQVNDVRFLTKKNENKVSVAFVCHNKSPPIPQEILNKRKDCSLEILPKADVCRRTELYVKWLESASELAKAIALRGPLPGLDKIHKDLGDHVQDLEIPNTGITFNENQRKAIKKALSSSFSLIQGPPGTGKTVTGVALINIFSSINRRYFEMKRGKKDFVVFCGPSNKSVDLVTVYLKRSCPPELNILRMYGSSLECKAFPIPGKVFSKRKSESAPDESLNDVTLHNLIRKSGNKYAEKIRDFDKKFKQGKEIDYQDIKDYKKYINKAVQEEIPKYDVILCTTAVVTSSRLLHATAKSIYQLLIDEAGMCTEPECLSAIVATQAKQVVLIGDHKQLQPVVICQEAAALGLQKSMFERYAESQTSGEVLTLLTDQYRMHPSLCRFPSNTFYDKKLRTKDLEKWKMQQPLSLWRDPKNPLVFCHIEGQEEYLSNTTEEGNEMSKFNNAEIDQVEKVYQHLLKQEGISPENIYIMSQYNAQCSKIKERLKRYVPQVNTVVASQGGEWDYVIFSLVRSLPEYRIEPHPTKGWCKENLGFIIDYHQINVALTRARKGLIMIGNKKLLKCDDIFKTLLDEYEQKKCLETADNFPPVKKKKEQRKAWVP